MRSFKPTILASASILLFATTFNTPAFAQAAVSGSGSPLVAPYFAQTMACYLDVATSAPASAFDHVTLNTLSAFPPPLTTIGNSSCNGMGSGADTFQTVSSSSGNGLLAMYTHDISILGAMPIDMSGNHVIFGPIAYGLSDTALSQSDIDVWTFGTNNLAHGTPSTFLDKTFQSGGDYPIPATIFGSNAPIQIPVSIDPVAIGYNPNFASGSGHVFLIHTGDGKIHLDRTAYCGIFNGTITNWNDPILTSQNGGFSLTGGVSATIHLIGRSDSSDTTATLRRHLASVCTGTPNYYTDGPNTLPINSSNQLPNGVTFITAAGSGGVASSLNNTAGGIAYIGPDYLLPAVINTGINAFNLPAATVINANNSVAYAPTGTNAALAFNTFLPPQSNANGTYNPTAPGNRLSIFQWVPTTANSGIANPVSGYPIIGTTNIILSRHYDANSFLALAGQVANLDPYDGFLTNYYDNSNIAPCMVLPNAGLGCLPSSWNTAITESFITGADGLGQEIVTP